MSEVKWIKVVTDVFEDEKILLIESMPEADSLIVIWFKLLCLAGKQNNSGVFMMNGRIPYTAEMFATIFRRPVNTVRLAFQVFEQYGMIEYVNDAVTLPNWEKHQSLDTLEMAREKTRERVARHREKQRLLADGNVTCNVTDPVTVTVGNADRIDKIRIDKKRIERDRETDIDKKEREREPAGARRPEPSPYSLNISNTGNEGVDARRPRPARPTLDEVRDYAQEMGYTIWMFDPERFFDFYTSKDWYVGAVPMQDWRAAVRLWVSRWRGENPREARQVYVDPIDQMTPEQKQAEADRLRREHRAEREAMKKKA